MPEVRHKVVADYPIINRNPQSITPLPLATLDQALNKYRDKIMFPEKLAKANKMLETAKLPPNRNRD